MDNPIVGATIFCALIAGVGILMFIAGLIQGLGRDYHHPYQNLHQAYADVAIVFVIGGAIVFAFGIASVLWVNDLIPSIPPPIL